MDDRMIWLDLETTGLDSQYDETLEVGIVVTNSSLEVQCSKSWVINPWITEQNFDNHFYTMTQPFVVAMHQKSGLIDDIRMNGDRRETVEKDAVDWLLDYGLVPDHPDERYPMCGNNIPFDRAFLKSDLPLLEECFHYRNLDVSSIKNAYRIEKAFCDTDQPDWVSVGEKAHRAIRDCEESIREYAFYREFFFK